MFLGSFNSYGYGFTKFAKAIPTWNTNLETPVPVRSLKLSNFGHGWMRNLSMDNDMYAVATQKRRNGTSIIMYTCASGAKKSHTKSFNSLDAGLSSVILPLFVWEKEN